MDIGIILALLVGLTAGVLAALLIDSYHLGQKVKQANSNRNLTQQELDRTKTDMANVEKELAVAQNELKNLSRETTRREVEAAALQGKLDTAAARIEALNHNLDQVNEHLDELRRDNRALQGQLQSAHSENSLLRDNLQRLETQLEEAREENRAICQQMSVTEVEMKHLRQKLEEMREQKAEAARLRRQLSLAEDNLRAAQEEIEQLSGRIKALQAQIAITGKNPLEVIKGIGPTYAKRLNEYGIYTLEDLAQADPAAIADHIELKPWQAVYPAAWITEARALAAKINEEIQEQL
ncbi:MAG TPA: hypothetical protein ENJ93_04080 [Chloroflexi bacterium]|nr:hypothetical protein [Chloroflexota bacterium]